MAGELVGLARYAGLALVLSTSQANAQIDACSSPDSDFNHLECYKITDVMEAPYTFDLLANDTNLLPPNTIDKSCKLRRRADSLCIDVRTRSVTPVPPGDGQLECADGTPCSVDGGMCTDGSFCTTNRRTSILGDIPNAWDYLCYNVRCDSTSQPGLGVFRTVKDRFGERQITLSRSWKVCVPILEKSVP